MGATTSRCVGRKRSIVTDTLGPLSAMTVTAASVQDSVAGTDLINQVAAAHPTIRKVWEDGGCRQHLVEHAAALGIAQKTSNAPGKKGFSPLPKRWTVERTCGWSDASLPPGLRPRDPVRPLRSHDPVGHDRPDGLPPHRRSNDPLADMIKDSFLSETW
ncbi:hypothetical protein SUDANB15_06558 [Streptomyces sp. enrichment culture]